MLGTRSAIALAHLSIEMTKNKCIRGDINSSRGTRLFALIRKEVGCIQMSAQKKKTRARARKWTRFNRREGRKIYSITPTCYHCKRIKDEPIDWSYKYVRGGDECQFYIYDCSEDDGWWIDATYTDRDVQFVKNELERYGGWRSGSMDTAFHICNECRRANREQTKDVKGDECYRCWIRSPYRKDKWNTNRGCDHVAVNRCGDVILCYDCKGFLYYHR